jgi:agmatinase
MSEKLTVPPRHDPFTFLRLPFVDDLDKLDAHIAIMGIPFSDPYTMEEVTNDQTNAPTAIRQQSLRLSDGPGHYDFDLGGPLLDNRPVKVVDVGDIPGDPSDMSAHYRKAEAAARKIFAKGTHLITLGGDHGVPIPVFRALEEMGPITLVHVDAHLDWRDELYGKREGYSNPIRRASELGHIGEIFQIGLRGQGSARQGEVDDALAYGSHLITSYEVHERGMESVLEQIPDGRTYYLSIDADGLDPTVMPAVMAHAPGGLLFHQVRTLIHGLVRKGRLVGLDIVEITPMRDVNGITSLTAGQLILNYIGASARAGYHDQ